MRVSTQNVGWQTIDNRKPRSQHCGPGLDELDEDVRAETCYSPWPLRREWASACRARCSGERPRMTVSLA